MMKPIYKSEEAKQKILRLYDEKLESLAIEYEELDIETFAGKTRIIATGNEGLPKVVILHGINAGAPVALEAVKELNTKFRILAVDTVGQATKSAENRLPLDDESYGKWLKEVLDGLNIDQASVIGVSYGGFLLQRLVAYAPEKIEKAIFIVPGGFGNGPFWDSMKRLTFPLLKFMFTKKETDLKQFMKSFYTSIDQYGLAFQRETLLGLNMDFRRPPLINEKEAEDFSCPVYAMVAEDDVFFPGEITIKRCNELFEDFRESYVLKGSKHIPDKDTFPEIQSKLEEWLLA